MDIFRYIFSYLNIKIKEINYLHWFKIKWLLACTCWPHLCRSGWSPRPGAAAWRRTPPTPRPPRNPPVSIHYTLEFMLPLDLVTKISFVDPILLTNNQDSNKNRQLLWKSYHRRRSAAKNAQQARWPYQILFLIHQGKYSDPVKPPFNYAFKKFKIFNPSSNTTCKQCFGSGSGSVRIRDIFRPRIRIRGGKKRA